ncbi:MAG: ATP synthase F1 subunit gamma [Candidatus Harrisonbacteria bacterium CG10_big_fil_rev_8_21_14_0_10_49_15]|uniref:ATP synthase gamma chain n=1 Tax=Candidatus Harrisonbacteria bacterium CG10_big_fil_rev_8_21_14_0_10_49_15 TaxID=1974587 RepID=A0A2H0UKP8_9BACT|nr:MAG: ATP synthase F1 subunit gamma [Candidatus Harrisonbacteria bacterium CG10_big_fil_rev_8_21_14_0_10_49_15]
MASQKEVKSKIKTVGNIQKITSAMEMIARTKMKRAVDGVLAIRPYALYARELLKNLGSDKTLENPYLKQGTGNKTLLVIIAADKGLCGGYNANIIRELRRRANSGEDMDLYTIGKKAGLEGMKLKMNIMGAHKDIPDKLTSGWIEPIAEKIRKDYLDEGYKRVEILFTDYVSSFTQVVRTRVILPINVTEIDEVLAAAATSEERTEELANGSLKAFSPYLFEPSVSVIVNTIVPKLVDVSLLHALHEGRASEESMRMFAMKNATENAQELKDDLTLSYNRIRQQSITQEIAEIAAGAEAIS